MKTLHANGVDLSYVERGSGDETVVFAHSYLVDHRQFEGQIAELEQHYRVIAYDHRDHGQSGRATGAYSLGDIVQDAVAVIRHTQAAPCHFVGLSTGGFTALRLALHHRELLRSIVLMDTSAEAEPLRNRLKYRGMFLVLRTLGMAPLVGATMKLMFGRTALAEPSRAEELALWRERILANDPAALVRFGNAIFARDDVLGPIAELDVPALIVVGRDDQATPPALARHMAAAIPGAQLAVIERAGHLCTIEEPAAVSAALLSFFEGVPGDG